MSETERERITRELRSAAINQRERPDPEPEHDLTWDHGRPDQLKLYNEQGRLVETVLIDAGMSYLRTFGWAPRVMSVEFHRGTTAAEIAALLSAAREDGAAAERERIAREIEALIGEESAAPGSPAADREWGAYGAFRIAARIARRDGPS